MKRRSFMKNLAAQTLALSAAGPVWAVGEKQNRENYNVHPTSETRITKLADMSLKELHNFHIKEIEEEYLPIWDERRVDHKYGGVRPYLNADGSYRKDYKEMYYLGRAIWVFSYLHNHFGKRKEHLEIAEKTIDFIYKYGRDDRGYWHSELTQKGKLLKGSFDIYGDIYVSLGLGEYYSETGNENAREVAIDTAHKVTERVVSAEYMHLAGHGAGNEPGTKRLGTWQHFLSALTPLARYTNDYGVNMMARMCVYNILNRHWHPELGVCFEQLDDQFEIFPVDETRNNRGISGWHSIQAAWMCMDDALRTGNKKNFMTALEMGRCTLEKCWVDNDENGESGLHGLSNPEAKPIIAKGRNSAWGALDDAMVYLLLAIEQTHAQWAVDWFNKVFKVAYEHPERMIRVGLLHHPRRLFLLPQILDRIMEREGRVSDFLQVK
jgi:N-acylglucosamine 2-epimerase